MIGHENIRKNAEELFDVPRTLSYIRDCQSYDGGFGWGQACESHAGLSYCAVATLRLLGEPVPEVEEFTAWCVAN